MAEIDTSIYRTQPQDPLKTPLSVLQLLGAVNQNRLFNQTYQARENIGNAYRRNVSESGKVNVPGLMRDLGQGGGFLAGEAIGTGITNSTNQFALDTNKLAAAQRGLGAVASNPNASRQDFARWATTAIAAGIDPATVASLLDDVYGAKNPKEMRERALKHGIMSLGMEATKATAGRPTANKEIPQITEGEAILERTGVAPDAARRPFVTVNPPGAVEEATSAAQLFSRERARAANYANDIWPLEKTLEGLEKLGPEGIGPGTDELNTVKTFLKANLPNLPGVKDIDIDKIKNFDETKKYMIQMAGPVAASFGHGTDQATNLGLSASPNTKISQLAAVDLTKANIMLRRMEHARYLDFMKSGLPANRFPDYAAKWVTERRGPNGDSWKIDPRAFGIDLFTKEQLAEIKKKLKTENDVRNFNRSVQLAIDSGLVQAPQ